MRLPLFDTMDDTITLLERRRDYYQTSAYELQALLSDTLRGDSLLGVSMRVKATVSLREKILRKRLYLQYDNPYDLLYNLSDLIGLRAECRFLSEEPLLFAALQTACTQQHADGTFSVPTHPNIRFDLNVPQPQAQQNGLHIYRIDGKYHKNGVSAPFELQIKSLVHVFWAEVEHQLIYKNNSYILLDSFMKELLYSNYNSLKQLDSHLQLLYDQMQKRSPAQGGVRSPELRPLLAKTISDVFFQRMRGQMGFSLRLNDACDILSHYLLARRADAEDSFDLLFSRVYAAAVQPLSFEEALDLGGAYESDDPFCAALGCYLAQRLNSDYDWNLFFRMLFALEPESNLADFSAFLQIYRDRFADPSLYAVLPQPRADEVKREVLGLLAQVLIAHGDISMLFVTTMCRIEQAIRCICGEGGCGETARERLRTALLGET